MSRAAANRYAVALFELSKEKNILDQIRSEVEVVKQVFTDNKELDELLLHPMVSKEKKEQLIQESFSSLSDIVQHTLLLLLERKRMNIVIPLIEKFEELADEEQKIGHATVYTVKPLSEKEHEKIAQTFADKTGKETLHLKNEIDHDLIGGMKLHIGDIVFDGSVQGQLNRLQQNLVSGKR
ncbi:F0F1 ATP synthase subunit delta [Salibacterium salarium]|uniref:ATP synthase subunit delta n=1 Tax=Salibacterium salarium TaxID=284579 RepID=A0A3R9WMN6_9BACI|nr:F0F1 ATP synthase subunit delta [Salibacterium salarium]RSL29668.1 F0F1 ATP synthase subunit delta [Salibacterium salarium]